MKNLKSIAIAALLVLGTSITSAQNKKVNADKSTIAWVGKKVTGQHNGTINLADGTLVFKGAVLKGGNFTVDMTSINTTDLQAGKGKEKLDGHLKAEDFFGVEKYPTAKLVFTNISGKGNGVYRITADLTIKAITAPVTFELIVKDNTATTKFEIDRTKYDIKYKSKNFFENLGDNIISDDFELSVNLQF